MTLTRMESIYPRKVSYFHITKITKYKNWIYKITRFSRWKQKTLWLINIILFSIKYTNSLRMVSDIIVHLRHDGRLLRRRIISRPMSLHMAVQRAFLDKTLTAYVTFVWSLTGVGHSMVLQILLRHEFHGTKVATVRPFTWNWKMTINSSLNVKINRFITCMSSVVNDKETLSFERFIA